MTDQNKIIYTRAIATRLIEKGNRPLYDMKNPNKPEFLCWVFVITPKFEKDLEDIVLERKNRFKKEEE